MKFDKDKDLESLIQDEAWLWSRISIKISMLVIALLTISGVGFLFSKSSFSPTLFVEKNELSDDELDSLLRPYQKKSHCFLEYSFLFSVGLSALLNIFAAYFFILLFLLGLTITIL